MKNPIYADNKTLLIVGCRGKLRKLYCPFRVIVSGELKKYRRGSILWVTEVSATPSQPIVYKIFGKYYNHSHFAISVGI